MRGKARDRATGKHLMSKSIVCNNCKTKNNPSFQRCWKCGVSFLDGSLSENSLTAYKNEPGLDVVIGLGILATSVWTIFVVGSSPFIIAFMLAYNTKPGESVGISFWLSMVFYLLFYAFSPWAIWIVLLIKSKRKNNGNSNVRD